MQHMPLYRGNDDSPPPMSDYRDAAAPRRARRVTPAIELGGARASRSPSRSASYFIDHGSWRRRSALLTPPLVALLLVANLVPGDRAARAARPPDRACAARRARRSAGSGRLHVRLVALFSVIAACRSLLVVDLRLAAVPVRRRVLVLRSRARRCSRMRRRSCAPALQREIERGSADRPSRWRRPGRLISRQLPIDGQRFSERLLLPGLQPRAFRSGDDRVGRRRARRRWSLLNPYEPADGQRSSRRR